MDHKTLRIIFWNAKSISNKIIELEYFLNQNKIDIIFISETWLKQNQNISIQNYTVYRKDRSVIPLANNNRNVGGGVAIAVRNGLSHTLLPDIGTEVIETIGIELYGPNQNVKLIGAYFPGSKLNKPKLEKFKNEIRLLTASRTSYLICGDLNAKHRFWNCFKANQAGRILYDLMNIRNFLIHFPSTHTHYPSQSSRVNPSTIDIVLSNGITIPSNLRVIQDFSSDHLPVEFELEFGSRTHYVVQKRRCYSKANWPTYKKLIENDINLLSVSNILNKTEIDDSLTKIIELIKSAEAIAIPLVNIQLDSPKLTQDILTLISKRNWKRRQWQRIRSPILKNDLNILTKLISFKIKNHKNHVWNTQLSQFQNNSRQLWRATKFLKNRSNRLPPLKDGLGKTLLTDLEKANEIGKTFCKAHHITHQDHSVMQTTVNSSFQNINFFMQENSDSSLPKPKELAYLIRNLKAKKCPGDDQINNILLKQLPKKAIVYLTQIYRACMRLSYFPDRFKHAKVIPIPKPGKDLAISSSYRPISLLSSLSKLLEKIIQKRINNVIHSNNIFLNTQFGFRSGHSTNHQLLRVTKHVREKFQNGLSTGMLTFDVEKAFDGVWHKALLHKMFQLKFPLHLIKMIKSFLFARSFYVSVGNEKSGAFHIVAGVPQGSVLSPILYNIFTSDIKLPPNTCEIALFADDTAFYYSHKNPSKIISHLNNACNYLTDYCSKWKIKLNASKTQATFFTRRKCQRFLPTDQVKILNSSIPWKSELKYLGVSLDKTLTFQQHTKIAAEKALKYMGILYPLLNRKSKLNRFNKITLYKIVIQSILLYACPVWGSCARTHINKLQLVQNKCLKIILNLPYDHPTTDVHRLSNVPLISQQLQKICNNFKDRLCTSDNLLIRQLEML